jgi:hypothetical protein
MSADWVGVAVTIVVPLSAGVWAFWKWSSQREDARRHERRRIDALYVNPFLFAAEDLQSRLFNLLDRNGLVPLRKRDLQGRYATETLFLVARYFAWEQQLLRFTHFAADADVVNKTNDVRRVLASAAADVDPWCIFRTTQTALGQAVIVWRQGEVGFADTISVVDFDKRLTEGLASSLGLDTAVQSLRAAARIEDLPLRSRQRLADLQIHLVDLLEIVEEKLTTDDGVRVSVASVRKRERSRMGSRSPGVSPGERLR